MRAIEKIYLHCSASGWGTVQEITRWHLERGFRTIGYHWLITNLFPTWTSFKENIAQREYDGKLWVGRPEEEVGAHVRGENNLSLGICMVGDEVFTLNQHDTAIDHATYLCHQYGLDAIDVRGHCEHWLDQGLPPQKSCPNLDMEQFRTRVAARLAAKTSIGACSDEISG